MPRNMPKWPQLKKRDEKSTAAILSRLPLAAPEVEIGPSSGEEFEVVFREAQDCFVPLHMGSRGFHAEYDGLNRKFLEAEVEQVTRRVKALGMWSFEVQSVGGCYLDNACFSVLWHEVDYYRVNPACTYQFHEHWTAPRFPKHLAMRGEIRWESPESASGPDAAQGIVAGFNGVTVAGRRFDCLRAISVWADESGPCTLDESYIDVEGRTILHRRYVSEAYHGEFARLLREQDSEEWPANRLHIEYNGVDYYHCFDTLTDHVLGWPD